MDRPPIHKIVIAGGGTAGWMTAAAFARILGTSMYDITLVESDEIGTVGVGEATIPMIQLYLTLLGIDEAEFLRETNATHKLGIEFIDWKQLGESYFHPFGTFGKSMDGVEFQHFWLRLLAMGGNRDLGRFNAETLAARDTRFCKVDAKARTDLPAINYAYQFDASLFGQYLRRYAEHRGVVRHEGRIRSVERDPETGDVSRLVLDDGRALDGHFFIDCTGFRALLLGQTLGVDYQDWSRWLPCDTAIAVPCESPPGPVTPYTRATAREAGWQWRIPLQHRVGNGYVFCREYLGIDDARAKLLERLDGVPLREPAVLRFTTGHRTQIWSGNVLAIGLASGFLEPLESTAIHLVQATIAKILAHFPKERIVACVRDQFNSEMIDEYANIRDFLVAHYHITEREDTPFWKRCKEMEIPESLERRLDIFMQSGSSNSKHAELFKETSWFAVLTGQGLLPHSYNPIADVVSDDDFRLRLSQIRTAINERVAGMPRYADYMATLAAAAPRRG